MTESRKTLLLVVLAIFTWTIACSSGAEDQSVEPVDIATLCAGVVEASPEQIDYIRVVGIEGNGIKDKGWAVKSKQHNNAWYVAAEVIGPGIEEGLLALWIISGDQNSPGMINSVNSMAKEFTPVIPYARDTGFAARPSDADAEMVMACAKAKKG